jgi:hypothetical protein
MCIGLQAFFTPGEVIIFNVLWQMRSLCHVIIRRIIFVCRYLSAVKKFINNTATYMYNGIINFQEELQALQEQ